MKPDEWRVRVEKAYQSLKHLPPEPTEKREQFFWLVDYINYQRMMGNPVMGYELRVNQLTDLVVDLIGEWLTAQGNPGERPEIQLVAHTYVRYKFLSNPSIRPVHFGPFSTKQRERYMKELLDYLDEGVAELAETDDWYKQRQENRSPLSRKLSRALMMASLEEVEAFFKEFGKRDIH